MPKRRASASQNSDSSSPSKTPVKRYYHEKFMPLFTPANKTKSRLKFRTSKQTQTLPKQPAGKPESSEPKVPEPDKMATLLDKLTSDIKNKNDQLQENTKNDLPILEKVSMDVDTTSLNRQNGDDIPVVWERKKSFSIKSTE